MTALPIVQRELLVAARQRMTYLSRTLSAGILLPIFALLHNLHAGGSTFGGPQILSILSTIVFIESMLAGIRYTSDCISEERREGTLGLLFLTDLKGYDVVLGKVFARGLRAFYSLMAALPILALSVLVGGVTGEQIAAVSTTLVVCILFSLTAGAFISSLSRNERNALLGTLLFVGAVTFVPIVLNSIAIRVFNHYGFVDTLVFLSPYFAFSEGGRGFTRPLQPALWTLITMSIALVLYSSWRVRSTFGEPELSPAVARVDRVSTAVRSKPRRVKRDHLSWLAKRNRIPSSRIIALSVFVVVFGLFCRAAFEGNWNWAIPVVFLGSYGFHALYKFLITAETCRQVNEDRRSGSIELLLVTPLKPQSLVRAHLFNTWKAWLPLMVALCFMNFAWMSHRTVANDRVLEVLLPVSIILLIADTVTLPYRAILRGLHGERYTLTVFKTLVRTNGPPLAVIAFMLAMSIGQNGERAAANAFTLWVILCIVYSFILVKDARHQLRHYFRELAAGERIVPGWARKGRFPILEGLRVKPALRA